MHHTHSFVRHASRLLLGAAALWLGGCSTPPVHIGSMAKHKVVGVWEYLDGGNAMRREFTPDGKCVLYRGRPATDKNGKRINYGASNGEAYQVCDVYPVDSRRVYIIKIDRRKEKLPCEVLDDGRLSVEGRYMATRVTLPPETK